MRPHSDGFAVHAATFAATVVTFTLKVHVARGFRVPPETLMEVGFTESGLNDKAPPLQTDELDCPATIAKPGDVAPGIRSENPIPVRLVLMEPMFALGFEMVNVNVEVPPGGMPFGLNDLVNAGGAITAIFAVAVFPSRPLVDVTVELFSQRPLLNPSMLTEKLQEAPGARFPEDRTMDELPDGKKTTPPHAFGSVSPLGAANKFRQARGR